MTPCLLQGNSGGGFLPARPALGSACPGRGRSRGVVRVASAPVAKHPSIPSRTRVLGGVPGPPGCAPASRPPQAVLDGRRVSHTLQARIHARRVKRDYYTSVVKAATDAPAPAIEVAVEDYSVDPAGTVVRDIAQEMDVSAEAAEAAAELRASSLPSGAYEASLLHALQSLRASRKEGGGGNHGARVLQCFELLSALARNTRGPVSAFLSLFCGEVRPAVFVGGGSTATHRERCAQHLRDLAAARVWKAAAQQRMRECEAECERMRKAYCGDETALAAAEARVAELELELARSAEAAKRQKDNAEFASSQIEDLQEALAKATNRQQRAPAVAAGGVAGRHNVAELVAESDGEIASILGFDPSSADSPMRQALQQPPPSAVKAAKPPGLHLGTKQQLLFHEECSIIPTSPVSTGGTPVTTKHSMGREDMEKSHRFSLCESGISTPKRSIRGRASTAHNMLPPFVGLTDDPSRKLLNLMREDIPYRQSLHRQSTMSHKSSVSSFHASEVSMEWDNESRSGGSCSSLV